MDLYGSIRLVQKFLWVYPISPHLRNRRYDLNFEEFNIEKNSKMKLTNYQLDALTKKIQQKLEAEKEEILNSNKYKKEFERVKNSKDIKILDKNIEKYLYLSDKAKVLEEEIDTVVNKINKEGGFHQYYKSSNYKEQLENKIKKQVIDNLNLPVYNTEDIKTEIILGAMKGYDDLVNQVIENLKNK